MGDMDRERLERAINGTRSDRYRLSVDCAVAGLADEGGEITEMEYAAIAQRQVAIFQMLEGLAK